GATVCLSHRGVLLLPHLGLLLGDGPVKLLALGVGQDVAVALEELQVHPGTGPVGAAPGRVEDLVPDGEGERQARPGGLVRSLGGVGCKSGMGVVAVADLLARHVEESPGVLVVLPGQAVAGADEGEGYVLEHLALGDALGEELGEEAAPGLGGGVEGVAAGALGLDLGLSLGGELGGDDTGLGPRVPGGIGADGDDLAGGVDAGGVAGLGGVGLLLA